MTALLSIEHLRVEYDRPGRHAVPAVQDVSLAVQPGETVGLVGESGSGKSTLALAVLRLIRSQEARRISGRVWFQGRDLRALSEADLRGVRGRQISMVFQDPFTALNPVLRVREQMAEIFEAHAVPYGEKTLHESLERVRLEAPRVLAAYPHQLSGGQRQRVCIAMALLLGPSLLLADEPTTALDVLVQKDILDLLFDLQRTSGTAMLFITHHLALVSRYAQRVAVMKDGLVVEEGETAAVLRHPRHPYTRELLRAASGEV